MENSAVKRSPGFRRQPRRYQLKKEAAAAVKKGHPWVYRGSLSTAAEVFTTGQWLQLVGAGNEALGHGVFEGDGLVAIRVFSHGAKTPDAAWVRGRVGRAIKTRENLRKYSNAFRAIHGENDGLPGIVVDVYGETAVLQTYVPSVDGLGRYVSAVVAKQLGLRNIVWKLPTKRKSQRADRVLRGRIPPDVKVREGKQELTIPVGSGQKSGSFLDLRGLRKWVAGQKLAGKRVLNLFSYTGTLGLAAESAGAKEIWNVDASKGALEVARKYHSIDPAKFKYIAADIFEWLGKLSPSEKFDCIIVDPPMMASRIEQVETALRAYARLYKESIRHLKPGGLLIGCCCTARITRSQFEKQVNRSLGEGFKKVASLNSEDDHPVAFPEGDYLKILIYRR